MSDIKKVVKVQKKDETVCDYDISLKDSGDASIKITLDDGTEQFFSDDDLFKSLRLIRAYFESCGSKLLCNGARVDVYPSGMSRGMGRGLKAYILIQGRQAKRENIVDIFDYAEPNLVGSIEEQEAFYKNWISSLG